MMGDEKPQEGLRREVDPVDLVSRAVGLTAVLLPALGAASRWFAYLFDSVPSALQMAVRAPIASLAAEGIWPALLSVTAFTTFVYWRNLAPFMYSLKQAKEARDRLLSERASVETRVKQLHEQAIRLEEMMLPEDLDSPPTPEVLKKYHALKRSLAETKSAVGGLDALADEAHEASVDAERALENVRSRMGGVNRRLTGDWPRGWSIGFLAVLGGVIVVAGSLEASLPILGAILIGRRFQRITERTGQLTFNQALPSLATLLILCVFTSGLFWVRSPAHYYSFQDEVHEDGWYSQIGTEGNFIYLRSCETTETLGVPQTSVVSMKVPPSGGDGTSLSLFDVLRDRTLPEVGPAYRCPQETPK
jgi:hypothetical protein